MTHSLSRRSVLVLAASGLFAAHAQDAPPKTHTRWPESTKLDYEVFGLASGWHYRAKSQLLWQHDSLRYTLSLTLKVLILGTRQWSSTGLLTPSGLQPLRISDSFKKNLSAKLDRKTLEVHFEDPQRSALPLKPDAQDQMSVILQWGVIAAANPALLSVNQAWPVQVITSRSADDWTVTLLGRETLRVKENRLTTLHWKAQPNKAGGTTLEFWSAASMDGLPARVRLSQDNGNVIDMRLKDMTLPAS